MFDEQSDSRQNPPVAGSPDSADSENPQKSTPETMIRNLTRVAFATLAISLGLAAAGQAQILVGVNFDGRSNNNVGAGNLAPTDTAGVISQANFNNITNAQYSPPDGGNNGTTLFTSGPLNDSTGAATAITFSIMANDSWNSGSGTSDPNHNLVNGIIKAQDGLNNDGTPSSGELKVVPFTIMGLGVGAPYTLEVYTVENGGGANFSLSDGLTTYFQQAQNGPDFNGTFVQGTNTTPGTFTLANYIEFTGIVGPSGTIPLTLSHISGSDGVGISGFQVSVPEPNTFMLGTLGGLGMLGILRRRKA